jgi:hypothetical protein
MVPMPSCGVLIPVVNTVSEEAVIHYVKEE